MSTRRIDCGDVFYPTSGDHPEFVAGSVVGASAPWGDGSDATYATQTVNSDYSAQAWPAAPLVGIERLRSISQVIIHMRAVSSATRTPEVGLMTGVGGSDDRHAFWGLVVDTGIDDYTSPPISDTDLFLDMLQDGAFAYVGDPANFVNTTIYELWFEITGDFREVAPPCRLYPRDDRLGVGSGRHFPPPKSQQASTRRAGGFY